MKDFKTEINRVDPMQSDTQKLEIQNISKIGVAARDYRENAKESDFSASIHEILSYFDSNGCDSAVFSLFTILNKNSIKEDWFSQFKSLNSVFIEEFEMHDGKQRQTSYKVYSRSSKGWKTYSFNQCISTITNCSQIIIDDFFKEVSTKRTFGNVMVLLCGESNIVSYSRSEKRINDKYNFLKAIPAETKIILNPVHDKMTRHEMKKKREVLSEKGRVVISVWNKGKLFGSKNTRDGVNPPWTVFFDRK